MASLSNVSLTAIDNKQTDLDAYKGKVLLIVNVASKCGLTPQYTQLEQLYKQFEPQGFVVLGFPANDFAGQEPGTNEEIAHFCSVDYPVSFPIFAKITVVGPEKHPLYKELIEAAPEQTVNNGSGWRDHLTSFAAKHGVPGPNPLPELLWNFEKFLVGRDGAVVTRFGPDVTPDDPRLVQAVNDALQA
jgi:glutathione peroxidase